MAVLQEQLVIAGKDAGTGAKKEALVTPRRTPGGGGGAAQTPGHQGKDSRGMPGGGACMGGHV